MIPVWYGTYTVSHNITSPTEEQLPSINQEHTTCSRLPIADVTKNAPSNKQSDHEEDNDYLDSLLQGAIDGVNIRSFGGRAVRHQQVQQERYYQVTKKVRMTRHHQNVYV